MRKLRGDKSQGDIGELAGMKQTQYSRYESGGTRPGPAVLERLALALNTSVEELTRPATDDELYELEVADLQKEASDVHARISDYTNNSLVEAVKNLSAAVDRLQRANDALNEENKQLRLRLLKYEG